MSDDLPKDWFYSDNGKQAGPFALKEMVGFINSNAITSETLVWHKKLGCWKKAGETPLKTFFRAEPPALPPIPSTPPPSPPPLPQLSTPQPSRPRRSVRLLRLRIPLQVLHIRRLWRRRQEIREI